MRICYFADGRSIHTQRWMKYFSGHGHEMYLISYAPMSDENIAAMKAINVKVIGTVGNFHVKKFWLTLRDLRFVRSVLKRERIDILHSHFLGTNVWYGALSGFHPHLISVMGGDVTGENWKPTSSPQEKMLTPYALRNADHVSAWGPVLASRIRPYVRDGTEVEIVHGGVDLKSFRHGPEGVSLRERLEIPDDAKVVFSPRLIRRLYNIDTIAHAASIVCKAFPNICFVIALPETILDSRFIAEIRDIFAGGAARDAVRFVPTIKYEEMPDYFRLAAVSVSIPDTDGLGLAILESMACGTPTVIGNLSDYDKEFFEHEKTTLMVDVKDPQSVADAVLRYLTDAQLAENIANEARRRVEETGGYEFQMEKMDAIYHKVLGR
jgi:glycosyltransferase involved in cell wall biosynthesis